MEGTKYFVAFINKILWKEWVYMLNSEGAYFEKVKKFKLLVETQLEQKVQVFRLVNKGSLI